MTLPTDYKHKIFLIDGGKIMYSVIHGIVDMRYVDEGRPLFQNMVEKYGSIRLLIDLTFYESWETEAAHQVYIDLLSAAQNNIEGKIAYINIPDNYIDKYNDAAFEKSFEVMAFASDGVSQALLWLGK